MAIKDYFFNAILQNGTYDRLYNSEDMTSYLDLLVGNGVFPNPSTMLQVRASSGMNIIVGAGSGWINGHKMINTVDMPLTIDASDVLLNRIDAVIFYVDHTLRAMGIEVKKGTPATNAVAPSLTRTDQRYELCLAQIAVNKQVTAITNAMITDTRGNSNLCGYVQGLIQQLDSTTLFQQFESEFDDWFGGIKDELSTSTLLRKFEGNYTTKTVNEKTFNVKNYVPQYANALDILEVRINGLTLNTNEYTRSGDVVTLVTPIAETGTPISFAVYKSVDGSDAETVIDEVAEMQTIVNTLETGMYIATGEDDNIKLSRIVNTFYAGGNDYRQLEIDVYGDMAVTTPAYANGTSLCTWFNFWSSEDAVNTRRVKLNFEHCSRIVVDCSEYTKATMFDAANRNLEISNLQAVMNNMNTGFMFGSTTNITATDCAFWMTAIKNSAITGANQGIFTRCRFSVTNAQGAAYGLSGNGGVLQLTDCEIIVYNESSSTNEAVGVHVQASQTENVLIMTNCSCPVIARGGYKQDNVVKINRGYYCLTGNMLGKAALLYNTGDGMTEIGTMIISK